MTIPDEAGLLTTATGPRKRSATRTRPGRLRVHITCLTRGDVIVDLTIPTNLVGVGVNLGAHFTPGLDADALQQLLALIESGEAGVVFDREDHEQGERTAIWVE